ncbi:MAG: hypothetical protein COV91_05635 [Candidatus Taylorbacteria bacterium CG11_big_fil_rev_8_21_14_0_20_46_11]|uniref:DUF192 domain-containing protein n=1 Tax=Candidatus Taylorbacteria bacterium CG11_big_fil_rev_8_21_14_0_20_46_11 TaxID=1975025 RepID=A0A2H0KA79_9BACT|nr:MAG: hypothetical protein COV91_05635 [Candidatus Taylorbacteria bacterium CG11_big_fil_rev_8_21_14_0_20_46_11]
MILKKVLLILLVAVGVAWLSTLQLSFPAGIQILRSSTGAVFTLEVADTDMKREVGLGGRPTIEEDEGMLFVFETPGPYSFWMKGMEFPLDIVWLASVDNLSEEALSRKQKVVVVHVEENVATTTYPRVFTPDSSATYVAELPAGSAKKSGIEFGSILMLE